MDKDIWVFDEEDEMIIFEKSDKRPCLKSKRSVAKSLKRRASPTVSVAR